MTGTDRTATPPRFSHHPNQRALVEAARRRFADVVAGAQGSDGVARVALTGGGAGIALLRALAADSGDVDWSRVLVFFGDERFVPADSPDRNAGQAREALLDHVPVDEANVFEIAASDGEFGDDPDAAAEAYARVLAEHAPDGLDLHLLGMGGEGHVNSLFPGTAEMAETERTVVAVRDCPKPPPTRVSLTMPAINGSERVWLLVAGSAKADAIAAIADASDPMEWPASGVRGRSETIIFADDAASSKL